jgi:hypothetical protein
MAQAAWHSPDANVPLHPRQTLPKIQLGVKTDRRPSSAGEPCGGGIACKIRTHQRPSLARRKAHALAARQIVIQRVRLPKIFDV